MNCDINSAVAYVDGSYDAATKRYSYGCLVFHNGKVYKSARAFNDDMVTMRNVAGEISGAITVMKWCVDNGVQVLNLYYDYEGIEAWCTGRWRANKPYTQNYVQTYRKYTDDHKLTVIFHKVKSHSNNRYNDFVDKLAKQALGIAVR